MEERRARPKVDTTTAPVPTTSCARSKEKRDSEELRSMSSARGLSAKEGHLRSRRRKTTNTSASWTGLPNGSCFFEPTVCLPSPGPYTSVEQGPSFVGGSCLLIAHRCRYTHNTRNTSRRQECWSPGTSGSRWNRIFSPIDPALSRFFERYRCRKL